MTSNNRRSVYIVSRFLVCFSFTYNQKWLQTKQNKTKPNKKKRELSTVNPTSLSTTLDSNHMIYTAEQIRHKKKLKKGINFNLLVVGVNDLGKKTFINTLINQPYYQINQPIPNTSHSSIAGTSNSEFSENSSNNNEFSIETNSFGMCLFFFFCHFVYQTKRMNLLTVPPSCPIWFGQVGDKLYRMLSKINTN